MADYIKEQFGKDLPHNQPLITEFGCGTGLVGKILKQYGFEKIRGFDGSEEMMALVEEGTYSSLEKIFIGVDPLPEDAVG